MTLSDQFPPRQPYNAVEDFVDANVARGAGARTAFVDPERALSYGELQQATCRLASAMQRLGLRQESRVALLLVDTVEFPIVFWGAIRAGIVAVPLNTLLTSTQYAQVLNDSRAEVLFVSPALIRMIEPVIEKLTWLRSAVIVGADGGTPAKLGTLTAYRLEDLLSGSEPQIWTAPTVADEVAFWLYSSGSTGDPKGTKHIHASLMATARRYGLGVLGIRDDDVVFSAAKLFFAYGLGNSMSFPMAVGAAAVLRPERLTPDLVFDVMRRYRPTIFYGVPTLYAALLAHGGIGHGVGSDRLRCCISAGEALPAHIGRRWREIVGLDILDGIGSTEMLHIFLSNRVGDVRYGTSGKPVPGYEARILGEDGRELGPAEIGELVVRGPSSAEGYWNQRSKSQRTFVGEWTYTGDKYVRDADGYYQYCGRTDDMFKVSGYWVSPFELEAALVSHEAIQEAAVIGRAAEDGLIKPKAFIVLKNGYAASEDLFEALRAHVKERAGLRRYPHWFEVRAELPKTATGKIQRFRLREEDGTA